MKHLKLIGVVLVITSFLFVAFDSFERPTDVLESEKQTGALPGKKPHSSLIKKGDLGMTDNRTALNIMTKDLLGPSNVPEGYAVISGVSNYPGSDHDLQYSDDDANDVYNLVKNTFHVPSSNIVRLLNYEATTSAITSAVSNFASMMDADDTLFFYFSGHGSSAEQINTQLWSVQSSHPYSNNMDQYWHLSVPGVQMMRVHFTRVDTETLYDIVYIGDNADRYTCWDYFTGGPYYDVWSYWVFTDDIYVNLYTDYTVTDWGFQIDKVETLTWISPQEFIPYDGLTNGFTGPELDSLFDTVPGKVIMVMDTCNSGGVGSAIQATGRYAMTACQWNEFSLEDSTAYNGVFTRYFLQPWTQSYDTNNDGTVSFEETFSYISSNTISRSTALGSVHHPQQYDGIAGSTIFQPNAKINSNTVDGSFNTNVDFYLNGLGYGELLCIYYDKNTHTYELQKNESSLIPSPVTFARTITPPTGGFTTSAVTTIVNARYHDYIEHVNSSVNVAGPAFSSVTDSDGDGVSDLIEFYQGTNMWDVDSDNDGMRDNFEIQYSLNCFYNDAAFDPDNDGIPNLDEFLNGLNPNAANNFTDKDSDGLYDLVEYSISSNISNPDTDGDGMYDGWEYTYTPTVNIFVPDAGLDPDGDGLTNFQEYQHMSNPGSSDSDADGMPDGWEHAYGLNLIVNDANSDKDGDSATNIQEFNAGSNATNVDTDGDGMRDGWEISFSPAVNVLVADNDTDPDGDGLTNFQEYQHMSNPGSSDSDADGMPDGWEYIYGMILSLDDSQGDIDHDGLINVLEYELNADPTDRDTDRDGLNDYLEYMLGSSPTTVESDGDGYLDYYEYSIGSDPGNAGDTPLLHLLAFSMIVFVVITALIGANHIGKRKVFRRPSVPGPRPSQSSYNAPTTLTKPAYNTLYGSPQSIPSSGPTIILPLEIQRQIDALPYFERELVRAMIVKKIREKLEEEKRIFASQTSQDSCRRCGGPMFRGRCLSCGYTDSWF